MFDDVESLDGEIKSIASLIDQLRGKLGDRFLRFELADHLAPKRTPVRVPSGLDAAIDSPCLQSGYPASSNGDIIGSMTQAEIHILLRDLLREVLNNAAVDPHPDDLEVDIPGFDSGSKIQLILAVEERLGVRLRSREVDGLRRFGDWLDLLHRRVAGT